MTSRHDDAVPGFYVAGQYRPDQSYGFLMKRVLASVLAQADERLARYDLTHAQWLPLFKLSVRECDTAVSLARELSLDAGAMTRALDRLEAKGLVRRERSEADRRVVRVALTDEGRQVAKRVPPVMAEVLNNHLRGFSRAEWEQLLSLLGRLVANADAMREEHDA
ncbi:MarR family winged helix-turn-helix transcriptional regulator [Ideonella sp.]|uniref:MarR family winged helix-turn-helix transcriptional regulator n=1 Tax=Ideonella sp. TaxID=1929293 RepID=UPI0035B0311E